MSDYPELTAEEYHQKISAAFEKIEDLSVLRYFYVFIFEKLARIYGRDNQENATK